LAEDVMAAMAVGRALKLPLETMVEAVRQFTPLSGRCAFVVERNGVRFFDDHRAETPEATRQALLSVPAGQPGEPNVILIAGGRDDGADFYDLGPLLARRVKRVIVLGESAERLRAAWSLFTPCSEAGTLLEALPLAVQGAVAGDVVLWSPACFSRDQFPDHQRAGEVYRNAILTLPGPTNGGPLSGTPTGGAGSGASVSPSTQSNMPADDLPRDFERENPGAKMRNTVIGNS
jgi:UDP-N-acetylmuramoylalanine--D-glutamate ligase